MKINHNIPALRTLNVLEKVNKQSASAMEKLSSGLRINRASDDAAGMAIAQKMNTQVKGIDQANRNVMDGISMIQTAEGAYNEVHAMLQRMRELTVQAANGSNEQADIDTIQSEIDQLAEEIKVISERTEFNKKTLLSDKTENIFLQTGANEGQLMEIELGDLDIEENVLQHLEDLAYDTPAHREEAIEKIDAAIEGASAARSKLGAYQNRLEHTSNNLGVSGENMTASMSRIQDTDMAQEMAEFTKLNVLSQTATSMLAQANQRPQQVLQLLQR